MKYLKCAVIMAALAATHQAQASLYDISFTGTGISATGQVDLNSSDIATSGYLDVTFNGVTIAYQHLAPVGVVAVNTHGDDFFDMDNYLNPNSTTQGSFLTQNGLVFYNGSSYNPAGGMIALSNDGNNIPNLLGLGEVPAGYGYFNPNVDGTLTVSLTPVPETTTVVAGALLVLPFGASALRRLLRKRQIV